MIINAIVQKGQNKDICDDGILINNDYFNEGIKNQEISHCSCICVADGVGGNKGGQLASKFVLSKVKTNNFENYTIDDFKIFFQNVNMMLLEYGRENNLIDMATTFTGLFIVKNEKYIVHIGNTRVYVVQGNYLKQLTIDHTNYQYFMLLGNREMTKKINKNEIYGCFGGGKKEYLFPLQVYKIGNNFNKFLFTSDGIHDYLSIDDLEENLNDDSYLSKIVNKATNNHSTDDKSIIYLNMNQEV